MTADGGGQHGPVVIEGQPFADRGDAGLGSGRMPGHRLKGDGGAPASSSWTVWMALPGQVRGSGWLPWTAALSGRADTAGCRRFARTARSRARQRDCRQRPAVRRLGVVFPAVVVTASAQAHPASAQRTRARPARARCRGIRARHGRFTRHGRFMIWPPNSGSRRAEPASRCMVRHRRGNAISVIAPASRRVARAAPVGGGGAHGFPAPARAIRCLSPVVVPAARRRPFPPANPGPQASG
jgi:hypothetical protein